MKKLINDGETIIVKLRRRREPISNNKDTERFFELSLLLFVSFWCIVLFYSKFGLVHGVEGTYNRSFFHIFITFYPFFGLLSDALFSLDL